MQRNVSHGQPKRRTGAEQDAAQPIGGQPRAGDEEDHLQEPEFVPSFLSARELQAKDPAAGEKDPDPAAGERHATAEFRGAKGEPFITDDEPPRGERGLPEEQTQKLQRKKPNGK